MKTKGWRNIAIFLCAFIAVALEGKNDMPMLKWMGDEEARRATKNGAMKILREDRALSYGTGDNLLVHGDNLEALRAILPFYAGQVKCIYIDPPYNTGSAFEHYDDNLEHSTWLNMMYPRLKLLREFLSEDGSIWISIDDREGAYLRVVCDEIFGRQNFINSIHWQRAYSTKGDSKSITTQGEHILAFKKSDLWRPNKLERTEKTNKVYKNPDNDVSLWRNSDAFAPSASTHQGMVYAVQSPFTGKMIYPTRNRCWPIDQEQLLAIMREWCPYELKDLGDEKERAFVCGVATESVRKGVKAIVLSQSVEESEKIAKKVYERGRWPRFFFNSNGYGGIARKTYLDDVGGVTPTNWWPNEDVGHTDEAKKEVLKVFDGQSPFATPKPERLIQRILTIATNPGDLVLDSFLGSGTTAAVAHKMGRRWIGIEMGDHAKTHCAVRMKKVVDGEAGGISTAVGWQGGGGFRYYDLGEAILKPDGTLTADIPFETMAAHVWFTETERPYGRPARKSTVLGIHDGVAYALLYNGILGDRSVGGGNVLTKKTLKVIQEDRTAAGIGEVKKLVVYAEACRLSADTLAAEKIVFRQTPYDLVVRR